MPYFPPQGTAAYEDPAPPMSRLLLLERLYMAAHAWHRTDPRDTDSFEQAQNGLVGALQALEAYDAQH